MKKAIGRNSLIKIVGLIATINLSACNVSIKSEEDGKVIKEGALEFHEKQEEAPLPIRTIKVRPSIVGLDEAKKYFLEFAAADGKLLFVNRSHELPEICKEKDLLGDPNKLIFKCHEFYKTIPISAQEVGQEIAVEIFEAPEVPVVKLRLMEASEEEFPILVSEILADLDQPTAIKINASSTFVYQLYFNTEFQQHYDLGCLMNPYTKMRDEIAEKYRQYQLENPELVDGNLEEALLTIDSSIYQPDVDLQKYFEFLNQEYKCLLQPESLD
ncbi:MAG: hypothetical protein HYV97_11945 [Bdellovibrio sp.]|nr:hypothetical protein [Bdellovibrio sp.]